MSEALGYVVTITKREMFVKIQVQQLLFFTMNAIRKRTEFRQIINGLKSAPCADCGQSFPPYCMDYDHLPGTEKLFSIAGSFFRIKRLEDILLEIKKCDLVCACCHRKRTESRIIRKPVKELPPPRNRKLVELNTGKEFSTMTAAAKHFNLSMTAVSLCCVDGKERNSCRFKYADNFPRATKNRT